MELVAFLIVMPLITSALMLFSPRLFMQYFLLGLTFLALSFASLYLALEPIDLFSLSFSSLLELFMIVADLLLLFFFIQQGLLHRSFRVFSLALLQLILYGFIEGTLEVSAGAAIIVDRLSLFMFLIINIVGSIIIFYAVRYMADEPMTAFKKRLFIIYLLIFITIMNLIVLANSLLLFFFLFEMTTLASYLLIGFRKDTQSRANAIKALWMNQIGGVVILFATLIASKSFDTIYFDTLLSASGEYLLLCMALLSMAAFVKGASLPFDSWLLGAMIAPTPVSAMLHSATMVKIAPYLILKIAPLIGATLLGNVVAVSGALCFMAASYLALSRSPLKEILGYSTIALLGLMMALAAIGTRESTILAMTIILFHAFSKALLFLSAGVLEKNLHIKDIEDMKGLIQKAPSSVGYIMFGFISLTLPPFGLFMGKLFALASIAALLKTSPWMLIVLISIIVGSSLLVLLYFKVASALLSKPSDIFPAESEKFSWGFSLPLILLSLGIITISMVYLLMYNERSITLFSSILFLIILLPWLLKILDRFDRTAVYHCGEKEDFAAALFYFQAPKSVKSALYLLFTLLFIGLIFAGVLS